MNSAVIANLIWFFLGDGDDEVPRVDFYCRVPLVMGVSEMGVAS